MVIYLNGISLHNYLTKITDFSLHPFSMQAIYKKHSLISGDYIDDFYVFDL